MDIMHFNNPIQRIHVSSLKSYAYEIPYYCSNILIAYLKVNIQREHPSKVDSKGLSSEDTADNVGYLFYIDVYIGRE